jgi:cobalt-zinc-cadmium efflux system protein
MDHTDSDTRSDARSDARTASSGEAADQRTVLWQVLGLNVLLSAVLVAGGVASDSSGLIANALDNGSDSAVYAISLFAVGRRPRWKRRAAVASGVLLLLFGAGVVVDALRRLAAGSEPIGPAMMALALVSAAVNLLCLRLLRRLHGADVNLRAAETFSANDFVSSAGILVAGGLVAWTGSQWPDLIVGLAVAAVAAKGGIEILRDARREGAEED